MPVLLSRSECRWGTWHVVTYDISDPQNWIELDNIDTGQSCGTASDAPDKVGARAALFRSMLADPEVLSRWLDHPARFATAMGWCEQGEQIMARTTRNMRGEPPTERPPNAAPEPMIEGDDDFLAEIRDTLGRFRGEAAETRGGTDQPTARRAPVAGEAAAAGVILVKLLAAVPWDEVFAAIEQAIKAKKDKEILIALLKSWERIGGAKDLLLNLLDDPRFTEEQRDRYRTELRPKLAQAQNLASQARRAVEKGDSDDAKRFLKALEDVLRQIRDWIRDFRP